MTGQELKQMREAIGYTISDVAIATELHPNSVAAHERLKTLKTLRTKAVAGYARLYNLEPAQVRAVPMRVRRDGK